MAICSQCGKLVIFDRSVEDHTGKHPCCSIRCMFIWAKEHHTTNYGNFALDDPLEAIMEFANYVIEHYKFPETK